ncbi:MAG: hypothetical protein VKL59_10925 [Nostocaceae cyanobacterium]|nr:hypothetical protein [Nostocaceae cyanobacterium]
MTPPIDYSKIYTYAPQQHPNLILGSLQLLFWLFFRPTAFRNHLNRIDPAFADDSNSNSPVQWRNPALWKFLLQPSLILPVLTNLIAGLMLLAFGFPIEKVVFGVVFGVLLGVVWSVGCGVLWSVGCGVVSGVLLGGVWGGVWCSVWCGVWCGVWCSV